MNKKTNNNQKEKIVNSAKKGFIVSKVLYILAAVLCLTFIVLAIVLPLTVKNAEMQPMELCSIFIDGALVSFFAIGILWNVEMWFYSIMNEQSPFTSRLPKYLLKIGVITILGSLIPSIVASTVVKLCVPASELFFNIGVGGVICGIVLIVMSSYFKYASELQQKDNETL